MSDRIETYDVVQSPEVSLFLHAGDIRFKSCLLYTSPSPRDED